MCVCVCVCVCRDVDVCVGGGGGGYVSRVATLSTQLLRCHAEVVHLYSAVSVSSATIYI